MSDIPPPPAPPAYGGAVPPPPQGGVNYASWLSRVGANLLDGLVNVAIALPLLAPGLILMFTTMEPGTYDPNTGIYTGGGAPSGAAIGLLVLGYLSVLAFGIWNFVIRQGRKGQTLGKKWVGIKVIREANGDVPGIGLAL